MTDLISRCELFNRLATITAEDPNEMKAKIYAVIQEMPIVDVVSCELKRGKWRVTEKLAVCSECGTIFEKSQLFGMEFANYCPYCGADMRGEDNE